MLKLRVALANKGLASEVTKHLTKDKLFDISDLSKHCDLILIDDNLISKSTITSPRGIFPLKKPSDIDDYKSLLYRLGFNYSNGTDYLAEIIYEYSLKPSKLVLKDYYNKLSMEYSIQPDVVKWSVIHSFNSFKSFQKLPRNISTLKEFAYWICNLF